MTEVVAALIWEGERFLAARRPPHKARGLLWEFVGGILAVSAVGVLAFREKLTARQWLGIAGILAALILLNI